MEDTGIGIPNDKFDEVFKHFSRLTPAYEGLYEGTGLGLYTVKKYVEAMKGTIEVASEIGVGTCFTVTLPFIISDHEVQTKKPINSSTLIKPELNKTGLESQVAAPIKDTMASILVVEDSELAAIAVKFALKTFNCHTETAKNGMEAVQMAKNGKYDLILMDVGLPDFSGMEVAKKIRAFADPKKSQVPIIALTGHADNPEMRQQIIDAGIQDVISKPAQSQSLDIILQTYIFS